MLFRGETFQEAVGKGLEYYEITQDMAEINVIKGIDPQQGQCDGEFVVEVIPKNDLSVNADGNFKLFFEEDGVYVQILPPIGNGDEIEPETVKERLAYKKVNEVDFEALMQAFNTGNNEKTKIAPYQEEVKYPASLVVEIAADDSKAYATMIPPDGGDTLTVDEVMEILNQNGVIAGLDHSKVEEMVTKNIYGIPIQVATAIPSEDGENGYIEYKVDIEKKKNPNVNEDGSVDFHELGLIENVKTGQVLAQLFPPKEGIDGQDIRGNVIKAKSGVPAVLLKGKNIEITEDKSRLVSLIDGQVNLTAGKLNVYPVYEVIGNVDNSTGNIRFVGKVLVRGNVLTGFEIQADGDIEVNGVVEGARLKSGGNIILKRGAQGSGRGVMTCEGSLVSKFIENCTVEAGGDIVADAIMHSNISSKSTIEVKGRKGLLVGGNVAARNEIRAKTIGSPMATLTQIEVGVDPDLRKNMDILHKKLDKERKSLEQVNFNIGMIAKMAKNGYVPENKKVLFKRCAELKTQLEENIKQKEIRLGEMKAQLNTISKGTVKVKGTVNPGTVITIGSSTMHVKDAIEYTTFYRTGGEIKLGPYE